MYKRRLFIIVISLILIISFILIKKYNDNRISSLEEVIYYSPKIFKTLGFTNRGVEVPEEKASEWEISDKDGVKELLEFLSSYNVKKANEERVMEHWNDYNRIRFEIYHQKKKTSKVSRVYLFDNYVYIMNNGYYELKDGPVDMDWLSEFSDRYKATHFE